MVRQPQTLWQMSVAGVEGGGRAVSVGGISSGRRPRDAHWPRHRLARPTTHLRPLCHAHRTISSTKCDSAMVIAQQRSVGLFQGPTAAPSAVRSPWFATVRRAESSVPHHHQKAPISPAWRAAGRAIGAENRLHAQRRLIGGLIRHCPLRARLSGAPRLLSPCQLSTTDIWARCRLPRRTEAAGPPRPRNHAPSSPQISTAALGAPSATQAERRRHGAKAIHAGSCRCHAWASAPPRQQRRGRTDSGRLNLRWTRTTSLPKCSKRRRECYRSPLTAACRRLATRGRRWLGGLPSQKAPDPRD
jgi:hypothetical protein